MCTTLHKDFYSILWAERPLRAPASLLDNNAAPIVSDEEPDPTGTSRTLATLQYLSLLGGVHLTCVDWRLKELKEKTDINYGNLAETKVKYV